MIKLLVRKSLLIFMLIPLLHAAGFWYATAFGPQQVRDQYGFVVEREAPASFVAAYSAHVAQLAAGELGMIQNTSIISFIARAVPRSAALLGIAVGLTVMFGPLLGVAAIGRHTGRVTPVAQTVLTIGASVPGFFLGSVLIAAILALASALRVQSSSFLPVQGYGLDAHLIAPVLTLAVRPILYVAHVTAGLLEDELQQDYVRVARSKGLSWSALLWRHAFPNVAAAVATTLGQSLRLLASGLILVEALFDWRGVGSLFLDVIALGRTGQPSGVFLEPALLALLVVMLGALLLVADLLAGIVAYRSDPRLRAVG